MLENRVRSLTGKIVFFFVFIAFLATLGGCANQSSAPRSNPITEDGLTITPGGHDFSTVDIGQTATQPIQITNTGKDAVQLLGLSVSSKQFTVTGPSLPRMILPGQSLSVTLAFSPTTEGNTSDALQITANTTKKPLDVRLAGAGVRLKSGLQFSPSPLDFGSVAVKSSNTKSVTLTNLGTTQITLSGVTLAGTGFTFSNLAAGLTLAPNKQVSFKVSFKPQAQGQVSGTLSVLSGSLTSDTTLSLYGDGVSSTTSSPSPTSAQPKVHLTWDASSSTVIGYRIYRSEQSGGPYFGLNGTAVEALAFDDSTVVPGATYYYVVSSVISSGEESSYSNQTVAVVP